MHLHKQPVAQPPPSPPALQLLYHYATFNHGLCLHNSEKSSAKAQHSASHLDILSTTFQITVFLKKTSGSLAMIKQAVSLFIENAWPSTDKEAHLQDQKVHPWLLNRLMSKTGFLNNDILDQIIVCFGGCPAHCSMFSTVLGLYPLNARRLFTSLS